MSPGVSECRGKQATKGPVSGMSRIRQGKAEHKPPPHAPRIYQW